jgi:hypothetical protein
MLSLGRENLERNPHGGDEIDYGHAHPHYRSSTLLIVERRNVEGPRGNEIGRVHDTIAEGEKGGKGVAGQRGEKKI